MDLAIFGGTVPTSLPVTGADLARKQVLFLGARPRVLSMSTPHGRSVARLSPCRYVRLVSQTCSLIPWRERGRHDTAWSAAPRRPCSSGPRRAAADMHAGERRERKGGDPGRETDVRALSPARARGSWGEPRHASAPPLPPHDARVAVSRGSPARGWGEGRTRRRGPLGVHGK